MRFHILGIPHTASNKQYSQCAFTQKVVNICKMLTDLGHDVFHYGNAMSDVVCSEHISVTDAIDINPPGMSGVFDTNSPVYFKFFANSIVEIRKRAVAHDFLLVFWPGVKPVADALANELIVVEAGIGYPSGHFAPFKVFESYAMLHAFKGLEAVATANGNGWWYDAVIPNSYDPNDFIYSNVVGDYFLFMGLRSIGGQGKGDAIAAQIAREVGVKLIMAGSGQYHGDASGCEVLGFVNGRARASLYAGARAVLCPSLFVEPFCGVHVEAMFSGTPVISTDWGAFTEYNIHGTTGYRCRTFEQFVWAARNIHNIKRSTCREYALANFSLGRVSQMYDEYFTMVEDIFKFNPEGKGGWYKPRVDRTDLSWLEKEMMHAQVA